MAISVISHGEWMDYYTKLLTEERLEYRISVQTYIHIEEKEVNIGMRMWKKR